LKPKSSLSTITTKQTDGTAKKAMPSAIRKPKQMIGYGTKDVKAISTIQMKGRYGNYAKACKATTKLINEKSNSFLLFIEPIFIAFKASKVAIIVYFQLPRL